MKMPKVSTFLGCMTLETGGIAIGWYNAICSVCCILAGIMVLLFMCFFDCDKLDTLLKKHDDGLDKDELYLCSFGRAFIIIGAIILMIFGIACVIISYFCVRGSYERNHIYIKPMMVLMGVSAVLAFLDIFSATVASIETAVTETVLYSYQFVVIYSLYNKFKDEYNNRPPAYYEATIAKV